MVRRYFFSMRSRMRRSPSDLSSTVVFCHATVIFWVENFTLTSDFGMPGSSNTRVTIPFRSVSVKLLLTKRHLRQSMYPIQTEGKIFQLTSISGDSTSPSDRPLGRYRRCPPAGLSASGSSSSFGRGAHHSKDGQIRPVR